MAPAVVAAVKGPTRPDAPVRRDPDRRGILPPAYRDPHSPTRPRTHKIMSQSYLAAVAVRTTDSRGCKDRPGLRLEELLVELDIVKYREAFLGAGIGDDEITRARDEGEAAIEALIATIDLRGGSATKVRRRLSAPVVAAAEAPAAANVRGK